MGIISSMFAKWKKHPQGIGNDPNVQTIPTSSTTQPQSVTPQPITASQRYAELEAELARSHQVANQVIQTKPINQPKPSGGFRKLGNRLIWIGVLVGIPVGIIYVVNLPYPAIRQPVAKAAPLLLLPSNMAIDANFKKGQATIEEARQLIETPTSSADLDRGEIKLKEGKTALDEIPAWYIADWADYSRGYNGWGYDWRFTPTSLQSARIKAGQLEAKVFQEKNAQITLTDAEQSINMAKTVFQQAAKPLDKKMAIQNWQVAIDRLAQIPPQTMAGRRAQQLIVTSTRDLKEVGGLAAGNEKSLSLISAAEGFAKKAAESGRNPPHSITRWTETAKMWQEAINLLGNISDNDVQGYAEAQRQLTEYRASLSEVRVRLQNEQESVQALERANRNLTALWANLPKDGKELNRNQAIGNFSAVNNELEKVKSGTTVYLQAQKVQLEVQNQLKLLQKAK
ncbi:hypothetical protein HCU40_01555 [Pseudanabaena biceps]|nr:hypothetical protein [Pseudanabaena biceps]